MRGFLKENGYLAVMGVCLVCSAVLLVSVLTDRPLVAMAVPQRWKKWLKRKSKN